LRMHRRSHCNDKRTAQPTSEADSHWRVLPDYVAACCRPAQERAALLRTSQPLSTAFARRPPIR